MPLKHDVRDGNSLLTFNSALTIFQAAERRSELLHLLPQTMPQVYAELSGIDEIDTAGVQLLLLLKREAQQQGRQLNIAAMSPAVMTVFDLLQLHATFGTSAETLAAVKAPKEGVA